MMVRRVEDEYPRYVKNDSTGDLNFRREIQQEKSNIHKFINTNYGEKSSLVHMASVMKAKNNGKCLPPTLSSSRITHR